MRAKFIYEKFVEDSDPIRDMGIGVEHQVKLWISNLEKKLNKSNGEIERGYIIRHTVVNGRINARRVDISWAELSTLPEIIKFGEIRGNFACCFDNFKTIKINGPLKVKGQYTIYAYKKPNFTASKVKKLGNYDEVVIIKCWN
jgi:hypothetical protein